MRRNFNAFTLAEVLITLGIIGVVAAMTMPTLMNQTNGAQYKAAYKKALSAIAQGVTLNVALDGGNFADTVKGSAGVTTKPADGDSVASILASRMNIVKTAKTSELGDYKLPDLTTKTCSTGELSADGKSCTDGGTLKTEGLVPDTFLFFNDGIMFAFDSTKAFECTAPNPDAGVTGKICSGVIDVNGAKGPNKVVKCDTGSESACKVTNPTDVYEVEFYDQTILPASDAARAVLYGK